MAENGRSVRVNPNKISNVYRSMNPAKVIGQAHSTILTVLLQFLLHNTSIHLLYHHSLHPTSYSPRRHIYIKPNKKNQHMKEPQTLCIFPPLPNKAAHFTAAASFPYPGYPQRHRRVYFAAVRTRELRSSEGEQEQCAHPLSKGKSRILQVRRQR